MSTATPGLLRFARNDGNDPTMRVRVDREADGVALILSDAAVADSAEIVDSIVEDYDAEGRSNRSVVESYMAFRQCTPA